tara:strand:- start:2403 stop:2732 length:330 start_codon:yes stop_codon:yes gene_type:complete
MAFKMKGFPLDMDTTPVYQVHDMEEGTMGMANKNEGIIVDSGLHPQIMEDVIKHEKVHIDQIKRGDLDYDEKYVYWKGKKYLRSEMDEGNNKLPWEAEAYKDGNQLEYT